VEEVFHKEVMTMSVACNGRSYSVNEYAPNPKGNGLIAKVEKYGWKIVDEPGQYREIDKRLLNVDHSYQRDNVSEKNVSRMCAAWSWAACGCLLVAQRDDGSYFVFEGQHRVLAAMKRVDITTLPCLVFRFAGVEGEARGFVTTNKVRKAVNAITKYRANIVAKDANATKCNEVLEQLGLTVADGAASPDQIKCIDACLLICSQSQESLSRCLSAALRVCTDQPIPKQILQGLHWIDAKYELLYNKFVSRLSKTDASVLLESVRKFRAAKGKSSAKVCGEAILCIVNRGMRNKFGGGEEE
jgi:hypothetical protein